MLNGLIPSGGKVGDAVGNALAETTIGLYKTECAGTISDGVRPAEAEYYAHLPVRQHSDQTYRSA